MEGTVAVAAIVAQVGSVGVGTRPDFDRLVEFRAGWYGCLTGWADTLFEVTDALLCAPQAVASLPYLSLEPVLRRGWGSVYAALARGGVCREQVRDLLVAFAPRQWWPVFAVDVSPWPRAQASCSPRRGMCHVADPGGEQGRAVPGWAYQWVCQVSPDADSWTAPLDVRRVDPDFTANDVAWVQMREVARRWRAHHPGRVPVFCLDAGYCPITATVQVTCDPVAPARVIVRIRRDRVFYFDAPPKPAGVPGRPKRHGDRFACADPDTWPAPTHELSTVDEHYGTVHVQAWTGLHPKPAKTRRWGRQAQHPAPGVAAPIVRGTVVRVTLGPDTCSTQTLWLWTAGPDPLDLDLIWRAYLRRFAIEHTHRFLKQHLAWTTPAIRTPEQADLWTWITAVAYTQIRLARHLITDHRLPWEKHLTPTTITPTRARRGFRSLAPTLPTLTKPRKPCRPGPGRPPGSRNQHPTHRHQVITKGRRRRKR